MRTVYPLTVVLSIGIILLMFQGSGFNALVQGSQSPGAVGDQIQEQGNESAIRDNESISGERPSSDEGSLTGVIINTGGQVLNIVALVLLLPQTLLRLGFPSWFALPVGSLVYIVSGIGMIQFVTGRVLR